MALTTPRTWATNDALNTTNLNTGIRDPINERTALFVLKGSDEIVNNSAALQNDDALVLAVSANATYLLRCHIVQNSGATPGFKVDVTMPAGASWKPGTFDCGSSAANEQTGVMSTAAISGITGAAADAFVDFEAVVVISATSGNVQVRWAQNTANASDTTVRAGSWLELARKI